jgi:TPR repeat protein
LLARYYIDYALSNATSTLLYQLGMSMANSKTKDDKVLGIAYFRAAVERGVPDSEYQLARLLVNYGVQNGETGQEIISLLTKLADNGHSPDAACLLGELYFNGDAALGIQKNDGLAAHYLRMSANHEHALSLTLLKKWFPNP